VDSVKQPVSKKDLEWTIYVYLGCTKYNAVYCTTSTTLEV